MKIPIIFPALFLMILSAGLEMATAVGDAVEDLESVDESWPIDIEYNDVKNGVFVKIDHIEDAEKSTALDDDKVETINGELFWLSRYSFGGKVTYIRIRLTEATLRHIIIGRKKHENIRYFALREMDKAKLDKNVVLELLTIATQDPKASVRKMAYIKLTDFRPREEVVHLLIRGLKDPCISVAHSTLFPLLDFYDINEPNGKRPSVLLGGNGPPELFYRSQHKNILRVAELLKLKHIELISEKDIELIGSREIPSDAWFQSLSIDPDKKVDLKLARKLYRQRYL